MRETIKLCCLVALTLCGCAVLLEASSLLHDVHAHATVTLENLDRNLIVLGVTLSEVQKGAKEWQTASRAQASETTTAMSSVAVAAGKLSNFISKTDESINSELLPNLSSSVTQQNAALLADSTQFRVDLKSLEKSLADADAQINNPAIGQSLANIAAGTDKANAGLVQIDASLTDVRQMADKARATYLKPVNLWWAVVKELLPLAGSAAQVVK